MGRDAMMVVCWENPVMQRDGGSWTESGQTRPSKRHVTRDGERTVCGFEIRDGAVTVAVTADWHEHATCYNCVYRLWPEHAPLGFVRPASGRDFPLRRECPHSPGRGLDPASCPVCTPRPASTAAAGVPGMVPAPRRRAQDAGNPVPDVIGRWHIPSPYDRERCAVCGEDLARGELINIEYEGGVMHAACSDPPGISPVQEQNPKAGSAMSDTTMTGPGAQENNAQSALGRGEIGEAKVYAILALAAAVNRLAEAQEAVAAAQE